MHICVANSDLFTCTCDCYHLYSHAHIFINGHMYKCASVDSCHSNCPGILIVAFTSVLCMRACHCTVDLCINISFVGWKSAQDWINEDDGRHKCERKIQLYGLVIGLISLIVAVIGILCGVIIAVTLHFT